MLLVSITDLEVIIPIISGAIVAIITAFTTFYKSIKGKSWKEIVTETNKEEVKSFVDVIKTQSEIIKETILHPPKDINELRNQLYENKRKQEELEKKE